MKAENLGSKSENIVQGEIKEHLEWVEAQLVQAFHDAGLNVHTNDPEEFKKEMRKKKVEVRKIINGPESGYHVFKGDLLIKFIPSAVIDKVVI